MPKKGLTAVTEMLTAEVSLVNRGANLKERFPLSKSLEETEMEEILKAVMEMGLDSEEKLAEILKKAEVSEKGSAAGTAAVKILHAFKDELPAAVFADLAKAAGVVKEEDPANPEEDEEMKKELVEKQALVKKLSELAVAKAEDPAGLAAEMAKLLGVEKAPVTKSAVTPEMEALLKSRDDELTAIKKQLDEERDTRATKEWTDKAEKELQFYPGKSAAELGTMLKALHDHDPKLAETQFEQMKKASSLLQESAMLRETGGASLSGQMGGSTMDKVRKLADNLIMKSDVTLTREQAIVKALEMNPELYAGYISENPQMEG
jgi:hypothetical protein